MTHTFFGKAITNATHDPSGLSFQSKTAAYTSRKAEFLEAETEHLAYGNMDSVDDIWRWLEGPVRSATTGLFLF